MNAHFNTTGRARKANDSGSDHIIIGAVVRVVANAIHPRGPTDDPTGMQIIVAIDGDRITGDTEETFFPDEIVDHLEGVIVLDGVVVSNDADDNQLVSLGEELARLIPVDRELWNKVGSLRETADKAVAAAEKLLGHDLSLEEREALPEWQAWRTVCDDYNGAAGWRTRAISYVIMRSPAHTPRGVPARLLALQEEARENDVSLEVIDILDNVRAVMDAKGGGSIAEPLGPVSAAAWAKLAERVQTVRQNFAGATQQTVDAIVRHWTAFEATNAGDASVPTDIEVNLKHELLRRCAFLSPADTRVVGGYLEVLSENDQWWMDEGSIEALIGGMRNAAGSAPMPEHPWAKARRLAADLSETLNQCDAGDWMAIIEPRDKAQYSIQFADRLEHYNRFRGALPAFMPEHFEATKDRPSFFKKLSRAEAKKQGRGGLWWGGVTASGDYIKDLDVGHQLGQEWLTHGRTNGGRASLAWAVDDMPKGELTGIEVGFLSVIASAAILGRELCQIDVMYLKSPDGPEDKVARVAEISRRLVTAIEAETDGYRKVPSEGGPEEDERLSNLGHEVYKIEQELVALAADPEYRRLPGLRTALALCQRRWHVMEGNHYTEDKDTRNAAMFADAVLEGTALDATRMMWHINGDPRDTRPTDAEFAAVVASYTVH